MNNKSEKRIALVIGNSKYQYAPELVNPSNDATLISTELKKLGFEVIIGLDANRNDFSHYLSIFDTKSKKADAALFYFAGHGLQVSGENYLLPTDSNIETSTDLKLQAIRLNDIMGTNEGNSGTNIFILDACRNNPFSRNIARSLGTRDALIDRGLAKVETTLGSFIAFATRPGAVALDGAKENSPFTSALSSRIHEAGVSIFDMMIDVRNDVIDATNGSQEPWEESCLLKTFYFNPIEPNQIFNTSSTATTDHSKISADEKVEKSIPQPKSLSTELLNIDNQNGGFRILRSFEYIRRLANKVTIRALWFIVALLLTLVGAFIWAFLGPELAEVLCRDSWFGFDGVTKCRIFFGADI